jgi:hypothetical protein
LLNVGICLGDIYYVVGTARLQVSRRKDEDFFQLLIIFVHVYQKDMVSIHAVEEGVLVDCELLSNGEPLECKTVISFNTFLTAPD